MSTGGGSSAGGGSAPRGGSSGGSSGGGTSDGGARTRSGSGVSGGSTTDTAGGSGTPTYSKPRDGRPETGTAVARRDGQGGGTTTVVTGGGYYGGFYPWGWGGLGLGGYYGYYDPWDYGDPYQPSVGYYDRDGSLKLKVTPRQAEVYVDGYFAGAVDDYDGLFQRLQLDPGPHRIEIRLDGYEPLSFDVRIDSGRTVTYKGEMQKRGAERDAGN